jgi:three-Cys-motif partner protein
MSDELPQVGPWASDKLERLRRYLSAYTKILRNQSWLEGFVYIDAFAGAGRARIRQRETPSENQQLSIFNEKLRTDEEVRQIVNGSPKVALEIVPPFTLYVFVERDADRLEALESLRKEYSGRKDIRIRRGDCNDYLIKTISQVNWKKWRAVVFLDPFGMHVPWKTIAALAETKAIEVFLNFPVGMSIQRLLKRSGVFSDKERRKLDEYFGDPGWFEIVYPKSLGLFGNEIEKQHDTENRLVGWYRERLKSVFGYASSPYLIVNSHGGHLYFLIFAGPNETGSKIASHVLGGGARTGRIEHN